MTRTSPVRATQVPPPVLVPMRAQLEKLEWVVPVEMALAVSHSAFIGVIRARQAAGTPVHPDARVFKRGNRFVAEVSFICDTYRALVLPLDLFTRENL